MLSYDEAVDAVMVFSRCGNFPKDSLSMQALAQGLQRAERETLVPADQIVSRCAEISEFCPTDALLIETARYLQRMRQVADGTYDSLAGAGNHARQATSSCGKCGGTGWESRYTLRTSRKGGAGYEVQSITEAEYKDLSTRVDWQRQTVYSSVRPCPAGCQPRKPLDVEVA